jgi:phosphatidylserine/phosphatidylglycerophosphate/cardiolipin synthase-like enzyme
LTYGSKSIYSDSVLDPAHFDPDRPHRESTAATTSGASFANRLDRGHHGDPVGGNRAQLMRDTNQTISSIVAEIDGAKDHVHLMFYIWLPDNNGCKVVEALKRAMPVG